MDRSWVFYHCGEALAVRTELGLGDEQPCARPNTCDGRRRDRNRPDGGGRRRAGRIGAERSGVQGRGDAEGVTGSGEVTVVDPGGDGLEADHILNGGRTVVPVIPWRADHRHDLARPRRVSASAAVVARSTRKHTRAAAVRAACLSPACGKA